MSFQAYLDIIEGKTELTRRQIDSKHVGSGGTHRDPSDMLWLDGKATDAGSP